MPLEQPEAIVCVAGHRNVLEMAVAVAVALLVFGSALFLGGSSVAGSQSLLRSQGGALLDSTFALPSTPDTKGQTSTGAQSPQPPLQPADQPAAEPVIVSASPTPTPTAFPTVSPVYLPPTATPMSVPLPEATPRPPAEFVAPPPTEPPPPAPAEPVIQAVSLDAFESAIVAGVNNERIAAGLAPLQVDGALVSVARERSNDMASQDYFSHTSPSGQTAFSLLDAYGIPYMWAGENLARNNYPDDQSVAIAMREWMASQGHRDNMLNAHYTSIGVGVAISASGIKYFTVVFTGL